MSQQVVISWTAREEQAALTLIQLALAEDLGAAGDLTSDLLLPDELLGRAAIVARAPGVAAGLPVARQVFLHLDRTLNFDQRVPDGSAVQRGDVLARVSGRMRPILTGERTALNFLQRLSGVASLTSKYVEAVRGLPVQLLDTRKTTPGWRLLEKYAVRCGGGTNHRLGLYDGAMLKDNHLAAVHDHPHPILHAVGLLRSRLPAGCPLEVEVETLEQLDEALSAGPDIILLDNMDLKTLRAAVERRNAVAPGIRLEASGGVNLTTVRAIAETGVDRISVGALTHSAVALDIALDYD
jgi:nicotinate-nucleotide pyrophosphorylase (carboxylating)